MITRKFEITVIKILFMTTMIAIMKHINKDNDNGDDYVILSLSQP